MPSADDDLEVGGHVIPAAELTWSFGPSGGPGGQHANRAHTRAELRFDLAASEVFPESLRTHMLERLGRRIVGGAVVVSADESRSQWQNRQTARRRLATLLSESMRRPAARRPTRPTRASQRRRVTDKRARGDTKRLRKPPEPD
ncbi:MAG: alternative ribosome rescue aminoacyl-tRNA hydrolase ArfB [Acidimicrobiia bacterium]|jgi:ribosome-associated protein